MPLRLPARFVLLSAVTAVAVILMLAVIGASAPPASAASCGSVSVGYTNARLTTSRVSCANARQVVRAWRAAVGRRCHRGVCDVTARGYRCPAGGGEGSIRIRCADGRRVVRFSYGD